jgi:hypothetical protein
MPRRVEAPSLLVPAATSPNAPVQVLLYAQRAIITQIEFMLPPGPSGLVGFSLWHSSAQIIPKTAGQWIVANNETIRWNIDDMSPWPDWHLKAYNADVYPHTIYVRLLLDDLLTVQQAAPDFVSLE